VVCEAAFLLKFRVRWPSNLQLLSDNGPTIAELGLHLNDNLVFVFCVRSVQSNVTRRVSIVSILRARSKAYPLLMFGSR